MLSRFLKDLFRPRPKFSHALKAEDGPFGEKLQMGIDALTKDESKESLKIATELLNISPGNPLARLLLGRSLMRLGRISEAIDVLSKLVAQYPDNALHWKSLGEAAEKGHQPELFVECFKASLEIDPNQYDLHTKLGLFFMGCKLFQEGRLHLERAISLNPIGITYGNLGHLLYYIGRSDLTYEALKFALQLDPDLVTAYRGALTVGLYLFRRPDEVNRDIYAGYLAYARRNCASIPYQEDLVSTGNRIRVAYITSDFRSHPVARNMLPILANHDHLQFEIHAYADIEKVDEITVECQKLVDVWHDTHGLSDQEIARIIAQDGIQIAVILAGKFDNNRPQLCLYGAAPVHVSFHDASTSGLDKMDYMITDITMSPRDTPEWYSERLVRLPTFYLHPPIAGVSEVSPLPMRKNGFISFGSCNNPAKLSPEIFKLWSAVLLAVPRSRLVLKFFARFKEPDVCDYCLQGFAKYGVDASRLQFFSEDDAVGDHLSIYEHIDIALDPFPFNGSTTTFESLWMGVPVVTLAGDTMVSRWGASMLRRIGHSELIAHSEEEYVRIASNLAENIDIIEKLRVSLREEVRFSPLCDARRRTRHIERTYHYMWNKWRASAKNSVPDDAEHPKPSHNLTEALTAVVSLAHLGKQGPASMALEELLSQYKLINQDEAQLFNDAAIQLMADEHLYIASRILRVVQERCPDLPSVLCNLGIVHARARNLEEALGFFERAQVIAPNFIPLIFNHSQTLRQLGRYSEAIALLRQLVGHESTKLDAFLNLSEIFCEIDERAESVRYAQSAAAIAPETPEIQVKLGDSFRLAGELQLAAKHYHQALRITPDDINARIGASLIKLSLGNWEAGWQEYEARRSKIKRMLNFMEWNNEPLSNKTLLIYGEQGLDEQILFSSCIADLTRSDAKLVIDCDPRLTKLLERSFPNCTVFGALNFGVPPWISKAPHIDFQIPFGSLPRLFRNKDEDFPDRKRYLIADQFRVELWKEKLKRLGDGFKVGICWQGAVARRKKQHEEFIQQWTSILSTSNCHFLSLQKHDFMSDISLRNQGYIITHWEEAFNDEDELAAFIDALDLVITVPGTTALLAGALGKPTWVITPPNSDWFYRTKNGIFLWQPTTEIFSQCKEGETRDVIFKVVAERLHSCSLNT